MKTSLKVFQLIILGLSAFGCVSAFAKGDNRQLNIMLHNPELSENRQYSLAAQVKAPLQLNRISKKSPSISKDNMTMQDVVIVGLDAQGHEISRQIVKNPLYFRAEVFDPQTGGIVFAKDIKRASALLDVVLPDDNKLHKIMVYEVQKNSQLKPIYSEILGKPTRDSINKSLRKSTENAVSTESASSSGVVKVIDNGDSLNRTDLVFLSEGYTQAQLPQFNNDVDTIIAGVFKVAPYKEYKNLFNVWRVAAASAVTGAGTNGTTINTRFGANFGCHNIAHLLCINETKVMSYINSVLTADQADQVVVVVNSKAYGGSGGTVPAMSLAPDAINIMLHEVGHSFGKLGDEYTWGTCINGEPVEANVTTSATGNKWSHWLTASNIGAYKGARYCEDGMYRPTNDSMMNHLGQPFYQVNEEQLVKRIYDFVDPIDSYTPTATGVNIAAGQQQIFSINTVNPVPDTINVSWYVNNIYTAYGKEFSMAASNYDIGTLTLRADVNDSTAKVIKDDNNVTKESISWQVTIGGACASLGQPTALTISNVSMQSFTVTWLAVSNASNYQVQVLENGVWQTKATTSETSASLAGFSAGDVVEVRVIASNGCGESAPSVTISVDLAIGGCTAPDVPTGLSPEIYSSDYFRANWDQVPTADYYHLQKWAGSWVNLESSDTTTSSWFNLTGTQFVRVNAINDCGSSNCSGWIKVR